MISIVLDGKEIKTRDDFYRIMEIESRLLCEAVLGKSCAMGKSLDAVYDILTDAGERTDIHIVNSKYMFSDERTYYDRFMKMLRAAEGENKMIKIQTHDDIMSTIERGYGKINLSLDVTGRLENGYHLVKMVMASVSLYDELTFTKSEVPGIRLSWAEDNGRDLSLGEDNLIVKAARRILSEDNLRKAGPGSDGVVLIPDSIGLDITLNKNIPMAAGMAGGSADAAATLRALNRLYNLGLTNDDLCEIGVKLGADVPFCVLQGCYLSEGIGEVLTKLPALNDSLKDRAYIAFIKPPIDVSTKYVYEHLDSEGVEIHPDVDGQIEAIRGGDIYEMSHLMRNVLRDVTVPAYPIVLELEEFLKENGAINAMMTGSGSTVFGIYDDKEKCRAAIEQTKEKYPDMFAECGEFL